MIENIKQELRKYIDKEKALFFPKFFRAYKGGYGEGDKFLGIKSVSYMQDIAKKNFKNISLFDLQKLIKSPWHEERYLALDILINKFQKAKKIPEVQKGIYDFYLSNIQYINNWDLVDISCHKIVGEYLLDRDKSILFKLVEDDFLWARRIAIVSTLSFIRKNNHTDTTFELAKIMLIETEDILHKAVGWLMREAGKKDEKKLLLFIKDNYKKIPRTTLRYSIERMEETKRKNILKGIIQ